MSEDAKKDQMDEGIPTEDQTNEAGDQLGGEGLEEPSADDIIAGLQGEVAELKDRMLRTMAEMENVRRRAEREKADAGTYSITKFARDMLNVADNLRRALDTVPTEPADDMKAFVEGVEMTERELLNAYEQHGITRVEPSPGDKFDHNRHQAMFEIPTAEHAPGSVVQVVTHGYIIKDRLLRPAMVGVAKALDDVQKVDTTI